MPIYEYVCQKCGHHLEVMQKISDKPLTRCPECRGKLEKILSQTSFQLKGSGWYVSDYTSRGKAESSDGKTSKPETAEKSESKGETKETKDTKDAKDTKDTSKKKAPTGLSS